MSRSVTPTTDAPRRGCIVTSPSCSRTASASRTGPRLTPRRAATSSSIRRMPRGSSPLRMAGRSVPSTRPYSSVPGAAVLGTTRRLVSRAPSSLLIRIGAAPF